MNVIVFDTETVGLEKCFTYNIGYVIFDTDTNEILTRHDFVIEQIWTNRALFETAYYAEKRPLYVSAMKGKRAKMIKFGHACRKMASDIKNFEVTCGYAYNSKFDEKVFAFNCDWYKVANPLDVIPVYDIRGLVHNKIAFTEEYQTFCDEHELYTDTGNYSTTAESVYKYITKDKEFIEAHTALADSIIEAEILQDMVKRGCEYDKEYKTYNSIPKNGKELCVMVDEDIVFEQEYKRILVRKNSNGTRIILK